MADPIRAPRLPSPGVPRPEIAWPTVALFAVLLVAWSLSSVAALSGGASWWASPWLTIPVNAVASFGMFTVLHDASHRGLGKNRTVNEVLGRLSIPFVACYASFPLFRHIHLTHHRFVNEEELDPDAFAISGPAWQLPLRWLVIDVHYAAWYFRGVRSRPRKEQIETFVIMPIVLAAIVGAVVAGYGVELAVVYLIPQRIALWVLAWWFDWLPHHGLEGTNTQDRLRSTRNIIGLEWLLTPLMFSQNYHLLHHVHPIVPFYRYVDAWRNGEEAYLEHDPALSTISGQVVTAEDYRAIRQLDRAPTNPQPTGSGTTPWPMKL